MIDGAFGDWNRVESNLDQPSETSIHDNENIDLRDFRNTVDGQKLSFYLEVDGTMMNGEQILAKPLVVDKENDHEDNDESNMNPSLGNHDEPLYGLDGAYIFLETAKGSGSKITEFKEHDRNMNANYMIEILGRDGNIISKKLYTYDNSLSTWTNIDDVKISAETDAHRMEAQVDLIELSELLNVNIFDLQNARSYYKMTDWSNNYDVGIKIPMYHSKEQSVTDINLKDTLDSGTRAPQGGWPVVWESVSLDIPDDCSASYCDIAEIQINDTKYLLYVNLIFEIGELLLFPQGGMSIDFYFNVTETATLSTWYKLQLYNGTTSWSLYLNYTTVSVSSLPDDNSSWTNEITYSNIHGVWPDWSYNGASAGVEVDSAIDSILFWTNKTNLSQGHTLLTKGYNSSMFADSHYYNQTWYIDRVPDVGFNNYSAWSQAIPEYESVFVFVPVIISFVTLIALKTRARDGEGSIKKFRPPRIGKKYNILNSKGGDSQ
jgi:hypothetical protein